MTVVNRRSPTSRVLAVAGVLVPTRARAASNALDKAAEPVRVSRSSSQLEPESSEPGSAGSGGNTAKVACPRVRSSSSRNSNPDSRSSTVSHF